MIKNKIIKNKVILLYGMPATGKYTMAKRLQQENKAILFDNHYFHDMFINLIKVSEQELPQYWIELENFKDQFMKIISKFYPKSKKIMYIFTCVLLKDEIFFEKLQNFADSINADFIPIQLLTSIDILKKRCQTEYRKKRKKISDIDTMENFLKIYGNKLPNYTHNNQLTIDTSNLSEEETFNKIKNHINKFK